MSMNLPIWLKGEKRKSHNRHLNQERDEGEDDIINYVPIYKILN